MSSTRWWWVDPPAGLVVAAMAVREDRQAWREENCCAVPGLVEEQGCGCGPGCTDACCVEPDRESQRT